MKILNELTLKNLKLNKKRTIVTIIGILLSTALICAVAGMVTSLQATLIQMAKTENGNKHITIKNVNYEDLKYFENNPNVKNMYLVKNLGYAYLDGSQNENSPYLHVIAYTKDAFLNNKLDLIDGRLPLDENELVISSNIKASALVDIKIGDKINLDIGNRVCSDGSVLEQNNPYTANDEDDTCFEKIDVKYNKEYTVVGIVENFNYSNEPYNASGYNVITYTNEIDSTGNYDIALLFKNSIYYLEFEKYLKNSDVLSKYSFFYNVDLLRYELSGLSNNNLSALYTVAGIVIAIIIVTSVFVIKNSFSISIVEKTKQYGMLSSIGATSKQIKKNVLYEGFILGVIGISLGILCGIFADFVLCKIVNIFLKYLIDDIKFVFSVPITPIIFSIILGSITIYFSVISCAKKSSKVTAIDAIRNNNEININKKEMKTPKILSKLFGVGGEIAYKNLKRNRKKYRFTVLSLVVSIFVFISLASFLNYGFFMTNQYYADLNYNIAVQNFTNTKDDLKKIYSDIVKMDYINNYSIHKEVFLELDALKYMSDYGFYYNFGKKDETEESYISTIEVLALGNDEYERYVEEIGGNVTDFKNKGILIDDFKVYENEKHVYYNIYTLEKNDVISGKINDKDFSIEIALKTNKRPMGLESNYSSTGYLIVSDELINNFTFEYLGLYINSSNATKLEENINKYIKNNNYNNSVYNIETEVKAQRAFIILISIFLYGFIIVISLIGITNIFNTINTNVNLRRKEFAMLKSIGMTKKEFDHMIRLESLFYGTKSLIIGVPLGLLGSYLIYLAFAKSEDFGYILPWQAIIIAIVFVFLIVGLIMKISVKKINKQNIIETIRNENI